MLSKISVLVAAVQLSAVLAQTTAECPKVCRDFVDPCGQTYGGCLPRCTGAPMPSWPAPSCSKTTTTPPVITTPPTRTTTTTACPTLCIDYWNTCGGIWGTCIARCPGDTLPTFTPPPCTPRSTTTLTTITSPPPPPTSTSISRTSSCPTLCIDYNNCGSIWGTCLPSCPGTPLPKVTPPPCTSKTTTSVSGPVVTAKPWDQCDGIGLSGRRVCPDGYKCFFYNDYYSQCVPA